MLKIIKDNNTIKILTRITQSGEIIQFFSRTTINKPNQHHNRLQRHSFYKSEVSFSLEDRVTQLEEIFTQYIQRTDKALQVQESAIKNLEN